MKLTIWHMLVPLPFSYAQSRFEVHSLPDSASLPPSWAGRFPVPDTEDGNSIFFWLFQAENVQYEDNLIIWFNGGPGCSSLIGLTTGNGPVSFSGDSARLVQNPHSWTKLGHVLYVDQPVGTGYSTASIPYPVLNNDRVTSDFAKWLRSFFSEFPHLQSKRVHLIGESYAGIYIPYFASAIVDSNNNPQRSSALIDLRSISLGDATIGNPAASTSATIGTFLQSHRSRLQIPDEIMSVFTQVDQTCGFDRVLAQANQYPPPHEAIQIPGNPENSNYKRRQQRRSSRNRDAMMDPDQCRLNSTTADAVCSAILNSTCFGTCATFSTALSYLSLLTDDDDHQKKCFDMYDIRNNCDTVDPLPLLASYFSRPDVQVALNLLPAPSGGATAPTSFSPCNSTILDTLLFAAPPVPPAYALLPSLVTTHNISLHVYAGENDMLVNHIGTELVLQNMTWNGGRGFSRGPRRVFFVHNAAPEGEALASHPCGRMDGDGVDAISAIAACALDPAVAGMWVSERGVTYHLFRGAGHTVFVKKPREMFSYVRDVVLAD
ncbi:hypothetical protein FE257_009509 [Aspergillus nanangensis]|uniref:Carboxypeptidase n=1 Tax=Aspergillus nanangensis TaxID=2582783 RepID=A0AAD4GRX1_ASPNN|nr:hypothetical protein FE257_009509 [Aspergillus nanangensis]